MPNFLSPCFLATGGGGVHFCLSIAFPGNPEDLRDSGDPGGPEDPRDPADPGDHGVPGDPTLTC